MSQNNLQHDRVNIILNSMNIYTAYAFTQCLIDTIKIINAHLHRSIVNSSIGVISYHGTITECCYVNCDVIE